MSIEIKELQTGYDQTVVIPKMNLTIPKGKITMIIGSNGCGKSTLLKSIARIIKPSKGEIRLEGKLLKELAPKAIARQMAVLSQNPIIPSKITVQELVAFGRYPYQKAFRTMTKEDHDIIRWAMEETDVIELKDRDVAELSGGQRQKVWIAMTLAQKTDILVLDEPTTYLDMAHQLEVLTLLQELNRKNNTTIVIVIHELNLAAKFADHLVGMKKGNLIFEGEPLEVLSQENLRELYGIDAKIQLSEDGEYPICVDFELVNQHV